jgi:hypothetical protein
MPIFLDLSFLDVSFLDMRRLFVQQLKTGLDSEEFHRYSANHSAKEKHREQNSLTRNGGNVAGRADRSRAAG